MGRAAADDPSHVASVSKYIGPAAAAAQAVKPTVFDGTSTTLSSQCQLQTRPVQFRVQYQAILYNIGIHVQ